MTEAAKGSAEIAEGISGVARAARDTTQGATTSRQATASLARMAGELRGLVARFRIEGKEASRRPASPVVTPASVAAPPAWRHRG